ncbi:MAG: DegT/DnrJ/EryC1/StrS family aminotransferase [Sphingobacteriaceae bacterium]
MGNNKNFDTRRKFIKSTGIFAAGLALNPSLSMANFNINEGEKPAILGGKPVRTKDWQKWPIWNPETDEKPVVDVIRSGVWSRASIATEFEKEWAKALGVKRSLTVANGTNALIVALQQFDIGAGDEVIVPPYTFIATVSSVLLTGAIPVFADVDRETFQIDPDKIEAKITPRTKAIIPVHICGLPADMDRIMAISRKHNLIVLEDACQAHLAEYDHKKVGTIGDAGCFSFQNSKNLPIGEGGAIVSNDETFIDKCYSYHNYGYPFGTLVGSINVGSTMLGTKVRTSEYASAIGLSLLKRLDGETTTRNENAAYLKSQIAEIPGIIPYKLYDKVTRGAFHLFPFRYQKESFKGLSRSKFLKALKAEGIPCSSGYTSLIEMPFINEAFQSKNFKRMYSEKDLNYKEYLQRNKCSNNEILCTEEAVWLSQNLLLGTKSDMNDIASAMTKIYKNAEQLKKI